MRTFRLNRRLAPILAGIAVAGALSATAAAAPTSRHSPRVGTADDGVPVYGPRGVHGKLLRAHDLDECGGHIHKVAFRGRLVRRYHYHRLKGARHGPGCPAPHVSLETAPGLFPKFDPQISDYVVRCDGNGIDVEVTGAGAEYAALDGAGGIRGSFHRRLPLGFEQAFTLQTDVAGQSRDYHVRCLPADFPPWNWTGLAAPRHEFYAVTPDASLSAAQPPYVVLFNHDGVPVWWYRASTGYTGDAKVLSDGSVAFALSDLSGYEIRGLDGALHRKAAVPGGLTDAHDLQEVGNGDLMVMEYRPRSPVDLTAYGGSADSQVADAVLHEIDAAGNDVWTWSTADHIALDETGHWWPTALSSSIADPVHINSVDIAGGSVVISLRHTDGVYSIDRATGDIEWKLGGTDTPESLTVIGDPHADNPLAGQHDARMHPDGTLTVHDNGTQQGRPPRAVRYLIDPAAGTATLIESVSDPDAPDSFCCGSARRSGDGSWMMSWGGNGFVTEFAPDGSRTFKLDWGGPFSYRGIPVPDGVISTSDLRAGMSVMHPR